jgi:hypothetical protein
VSPRVRHPALRFEGTGNHIGAARPCPYARGHMRIRTVLATTAIALAFVPAAVADAKPAGCKSADLRYPFEPGGPRTFGVFHLRISGGSCTTAHRVAKAWMNEFEANLQHGSEKLPRRVQAFTFTSLPPTAAQTYRLRGVKANTRINFDYVVPNG